jgi:hypothetical protein
MGLTEMLHDRPYTTLLQPLDVRRCDDPGEVRIFGKGFEGLISGFTERKQKTKSAFGTLLIPLIPRMSRTAKRTETTQNEGKQVEPRTHSPVQWVPNDINRRPQ